MTTDQPEPLVPEGCSMAGNDWFPLHFDRLRKSKWWRRASDLARARNVMLWGEAYKQVPAGSMPDDDDELAEAAGFGMDVESFIAVKDEIMAPWVLCRDGRWYHPTVCEVVLEAWERAGERRRKDAERKAAQRARVKGHVASNTCVTPKNDCVRRDIENVTRDMADVTADFGTHNRQDRTGHIEANASVASAAPTTTDGALALALKEPEPEPHREPWDRDPEFGKLWDMAPPQMRRRAKSKAKVWPEWQRSRRRAAPAAILGAFGRYKALDADLTRTGGPGLHIWLRDRTFEQWLGRGERTAAWTEAEWSTAVRLWVERQVWGEVIGPAPDEPGCRVPAEILRRFGIDPAPPQPVRGAA